MEDKQQNLEIEERDATLDPDPAPAAMTDDELQDSILEDSGMTGFQKFIAKMDDARWTLVQRVAGALLGILTGVSLFWNGFGGSEEGGFSYSLIFAVVIALVVPNIIEKKGLRRIPKLRVALVISLLVMIVAYAIVMGVRSGFNFRA